MGGKDKEWSTQNQRWRRGVNRGKVLGRLLHSWVCPLTTESAANFDHSSGCSHRTHIRGGTVEVVTDILQWPFMPHGPTREELCIAASSSMRHLSSTWEETRVRVSCLLLFPQHHNPAMPGPIPLPADTSLLRVPPKSCLMGLCPQVWHTLRITQYLSPQLLSEFQFSLSPLSFFVSSNPWSALL